MPKIAIIIYSLYGHIATMAEAVKEGIAEAGGDATIYQVPETLSDAVLHKMNAPAKKPYPIANNQVLEENDAFMFGIPTRYGNFPNQWKSFIDATGKLWVEGALHHKPCGIFVSTGTGGGNEMTVVSALSTLAHHGMIFVPLGYKDVFPEMTNMSEVKGGSAWGAGTFAAADGTRHPTELEKKMARIQGRTFYDVAKRF